MEYKCPECGGDVDVSYMLTNPPTVCYRCCKCDYHHDERHSEPAIAIIAPE